MSYRDLGYNNLLIKVPIVDLSQGITTENADAIFGSGSVPFTATTMDRLYTNEDMQNVDFVSGSAGWQIKGSGDCEFNNVTVRGTIYATAGDIGGWTINATTIASDGNEIVLDSSNKRIEVGSSDEIVIDGDNQRIQSSNYVSGYAGAGFHLSSELLEVGNIACRGLIRTSVFQKDTISAMGGNFLVLDADVLDADMTALDNSTLTTKATTLFAVGDFLRIKDGTDDEWLEVTAENDPIYTVTRDKASAYGADSNPAWKKGATVTNYKQSGDGGIYMTASESNAPYLSVFTHTGSPWSAITTRLRIGNLNGYLGYSSDLYGIAIGESTKYLKYDPTNGLTIEGGVIRTSASGQRVVIQNNQITIDDGNGETRLTMIGGANPAVYNDANGAQQGSVRVEESTAGGSSSYNHAGATGLRMVNDFFLESGYSSNKTVVTFMATFDDGRRSGFKNKWLRFKVNNKTADDDYDLSLFTKTLINPETVVVGICGTPVANRLVRGIGSSFIAADVGKTVWNKVDDTRAIITSFIDADNLGLDTDIFDTASGEGYEIFYEPTAYLDINSDILRLRVEKTPANAGDTGNTGDFCWDSDWFYICIATDTWQRVQHATW